MDRRHPARLIRHAAQRTCRRSMRTATAALGTTMSRPSSLAGSHRVSLPISSQGAAKDCALSLTWSGRAAENAGLLKRQHRSRSQRRFPEDALVANVGCRRILVAAECPGEGPFAMRFADLRHGGSRGAGSALASRLRAGWMEARVTKVARVSARFSKSLAGVGCDSQVRGRWMNRCPGASSPHHPGSFMAFLRGQNRGQNSFI